ncbi:MAG: NrtA/SsuA/CpmA family ABC transporter substrate-binding protein [bacterium]
MFRFFDRNFRHLTLPFLALFLLTIFSCQKAGTPIPAASAESPDLSEHPKYSSYSFGNDEHVVDIGIQPLWIPTNTIAETMKRDEILREAMEKLGIQLRFHPFYKGADVNYFMERGDLEVGIGGDMPAITAAANFNVFIPAIIQHGFSSIVAEEMFLQSDLRGKRIGYAFGSNAHYALLQAISAGGLTESDVILVPMDVNEMPEALDRGLIDAFSAWEPTPSIAEAIYKRQHRIFKTMTSGYLYFSRTFAERHSDIMTHIIASQMRSMRWLREGHPNLNVAATWTKNAWEEFSGTGLPLSDEKISELNRKDILGVTSIPIFSQNLLSNNGALNREFIFLKKLGKIPESIQWDEVVSKFDSRLIKIILEQPEKYILHELRFAGTGEADDEHH